jgi:hypothetical protein
VLKETTAYFATAFAEASAVKESYGGHGRQTTHV